MIDSSLEGSDRYEQSLEEDPAVSYQVIAEPYSSFQSLSPEHLQRFDGVLWVLGSSDPQNFEPMAALKATMPESFPPLVVVGNNEAQSAVQALKQGATDYLVGDRITPDELRAAMRSAIENAELKRELKVSQERFQTSIENLMDCFGIFTAVRDASGQIIDFRIDYLNEAACRNNRMSREQQIGRGLCDLLPGHRESDLFNAYCHLVETGEPVIRESVMYTDTYGGEQNRECVYDIRATRLHDGFVASWRDVTLRHQMERDLSLLVIELQREKSRLSQLIDTAPIGIGIGNSRGEVTSANDEMLRLHGYTRQEFEQRGMNWYDFVPPDLAEQAAQAMVALQQQRSLPPEEKELLLRDGTRVPLWISATQWLEGDDEHVAFAVDLTKQKQAEADLRASQQRYQELAEAMPQIVWMSDAEGQIIYWNQRWYEYTGLSPAESMGNEGSKVVHPDERDRTLEQWEQAIVNGEPFEVEYRVRHRDGAYRWFICRGLPTHDPQGSIAGWIGTITDIHEQKQLQEQFQLAMHAVNGLVFDWDRETNQIYRSENLYDLIGVRAEDAPPYIDWWDERIHPDDWERLQRHAQELYSSDQNLHEMEYRIRHEDGHWVDVWDRSCLLRDEQGRVRRVVGSTVDISDRKQAERALQSAHIQLESALEAGAIYTWHWNLLENRVVCNRRFAHLFGVDPEGAEQGLPIELFLAAIDPIERPNVIAAIDRVIATGENYQAEFRVRDADGQEHWLSARGRVEYDDNGQAIALPGALADITERHQGEEALRQSEERYRTLFESMTEGFCVIELMFDVNEKPIDYRFLEVNPAFERQTGLQNVEGYTVRQLFPDLDSYCYECYGEVARTGESLRFETYSQRVERWFDVSAFRIGTPESRKVAILFKDITQRKQVEKRLRDRQTRLDLAIRAAGLGVFEWDVETDTPIWENQAMYDIFNRTREQGPLTGEGLLSDVIHPGDRLLFEQCLQAAMAPDKFFHAICRIRTPQPDQWHWIEYNGQFDLAPDRTPQKLIGVVRNITNRILAQEEIRESEARFRTLADNISQFAWMADPTGSVFWYNQRWFNFTGTTLEETVGGGWKQVVHPDYFDQVTQKYDQCIEQGEVWEDTFPLRKDDGTYRWFLSRAIPIHDEGGNILRWFGTNTDITVLRQTELALRQTAERLDIALKTAPITLFNQDLDLYYTWIYNPALHYSEEEVLGRQDIDLFAPETANYLTQLKRRVIETGVSVREEVEIVGIDNIVSYFDISIEPLQDDQDNLMGVTCAAMDVSDRKAAAAALAANEARLRSFVESNVVGILYGDIHGNIHRTNDEFLRIVGYSREDFETNGLRWVELTPTECLEIDAEAIIEAQERGACTPYEKAYIRKDGSHVPVMVGYSLVGEARVESVAFVLDLTDIKQAEAQLERLLEREQAARTEAERANRVKDEFLAILSHELRTPLNPILGWSKLLQTRKLDEEKVAQALSTIERNAKLQTQLIDDLLDVARILRGKLKLDPVPVNLAEVVEAAMETVKHAAIAKSIDLRFAPDHSVPSLVVSGDSGRLQQVIWNLLSNAIKFTPSDGKVEIFLNQADKQAQIIVTDTGKGISPGFLPFLFESFRQEDVSITRQFGGLGLGLAIVRYLVEAHGGTVIATSPGEGQGATFTVSLPLLNADSEASLELDDPSLSLNLNGLRVLVVDDDADTCELVAIALGQYGAKVEAVYSADDALLHLETAQFDLLISDISMPETDGYAFIQQVRQLPSNNSDKIPAIALTARSHLDDRYQALNSGFQEHFAKPLDIEHLLQVVVALVQDM